MIPEPTIAASRKAVPSASARLRFSKVIVSGAARFAATLRIGAAGHIVGATFLGLGVDGVDFPSSAHWIDGPHFALISVTAGLLTLDGCDETSALQTIYGAI